LYNINSSLHLKFIVLFPAYLVHLIADIIYHIDQLIRHDLISNRVVNERDYMSRFITLLQYPFGIFTGRFAPFRSMVFANTLTARLEQAFGCDMLFVFRNRRNVKIACLESKYLHYRSNIDDWDPARRGKASRFSDQLNLQLPLVNQGIAVGEMLFNDLHIGSVQHPLDPHGSTVIDHEIALNHLTSVIVPRSRPTCWKWEDIRQASNDQLKQHTAANIYDFMFRVLSCAKGKHFNLERDYFASHTIELKNDRIEIPILNIIGGQEEGEWFSQVRKFMRRTGLRIYGVIQVD
jgi:hypothetical protein